MGKASDIFLDEGELLRQTFDLPSLVLRGVLCSGCGGEVTGCATVLDNNFRGRNVI